MFVILQHVSDIEVNLQDIELAYLLFNIFWTLKLNPVSKMPIFLQPRENLKVPNMLKKSTHAYAKLNIGGGKPYRQI
jgi:hypothetical protein